MTNEENLDSLVFGPYSKPRSEEQKERMLWWFESRIDTTDPFLSSILHGFRNLANMICDTTPPGPERTVALRKLLESRDCSVRAFNNPGQ